MSNETPRAEQEDKARSTEVVRQNLLKRIESDFSYHSPKGDQAERYQIIRETAKKAARVMVENCPPSRELSTALTYLETAVMHANASIARNE